MDEEDKAIALMRALVAAQAEGEAAVQEVISDRLRAAGCEVAAHDYDPAEVQVVGEFALDSARATERRRAIIGTLPGDPELPSLLVFAHPDGEPVAGTEAWTHDPFAGTVSDGRLYGWGVADDLAGCAAAVLALERAAEANVPMGRAVLASTPSKRYARGVAALLHDGLRADASLYLHPAESGVGMREIKAVASGHIEFRITVAGRAPETTEPGHTAFAHLGVNPIDKALVVRNALMALAEARAARIRHPLIEAEVGRATNINVSRITAGEMRRLSRMAETCTLGCAVSFPPGETIAEVKAEIAEAVARAAAADPFLAEHPPEITWVTGVTGGEVAADHPLYRTAAAAVSRVTGAAPHVNPMHTSSDIRNPIVEAGIPCVGLGCLGGDLSQNDRHDEWIDVADFRRMVEVTTAIVTDWCSGSTPPS
ncbi:M20 family metallopeptidase [Jannaschia seohaensis]|uniref:Acetylornithine deacetylase n=1 Tax=Jannaschia seohaensis TaxID=475081 RepID=A0A2Y9A7J2_9RHOB|nr:M20/M25/M40 family metallo-hydrolase [Jannaschia seohaensis]PWJ21869.1 acetylornithine deacetylase [Jannaschia seohaensis]SSA38147.1 acetylornithine deacetylase [Jannaschia seohaensis]